MADTTAQMEQLKIDAGILADKQGHLLQPCEEYAGGAVNIAECETCHRFVWVEIYPDGHDVRGPALIRTCNPKNKGIIYLTPARI